MSITHRFNKGILAEKLSSRSGTKKKLDSQLFIKNPPRPTRRSQEDTVRALRDFAPVRISLTSSLTSAFLLLVQAWTATWDQTVHYTHGLTGTDGRLTNQVSGDLSRMGDVLKMSRLCTSASILKVIQIGCLL